MSEPFSVAGLVTASDKAPDTPAHTFMWDIPPDTVLAFVQEMTGRYGQPTELLSTVGKVLASNDPQDSVCITDGDQ